MVTQTFTPLRHYARVSTFSVEKRILRDDAREPPKKATAWAGGSAGGAPFGRTIRHAYFRPFTDYIHQKKFF